MIHFGNISRVLALGGAILASTAPAIAQNAQQKQQIDQSLSGQRIQPVDGTALAPANAGYYRVVAKSSGFTKDSLCWRNKQEREALEDLAVSLWSWAVRRRKDWGAGVHLVFDGTKPNWDDENLKPSLWVKLFAVKIDGGSVNECNVDVIDFSSFESPLIPLYEGVSPTTTYVQVSTWYNDVADRSRIATLVKGGTAVLGFIGLPIGALQPLEGTVTDEIKAKVDKQRSPKYRSELSPYSADKVELNGFVGLREPANPGNVQDPRLNIKLVPVASIFAPLQTSFADVNLKDATATDILKLSVPAPTAANPAARGYLDAAIGATTTLFNAMLTAADNSAASANCDNLILHLQNSLKFSTTDAAIVAYGVALQRIESKTTKFAREIKCVADREPLLSRVKIVLPPIEIKPPPGTPATSIAMDQRMRGFAQLSSLPAEELADANWSIFSYPLGVYDPADRFSLDNSQASYSNETRAGLKTLLDNNVTNIGCWAYFDAPPLAFAPGLGSEVAVGATSTVRKSAALVRYASGQIGIVQFRYNDDPKGQKIDGIAFVNNDAAAKAKMLGNDSCKPGIAGKEWMQAYLRPPAK